MYNQLVYTSNGKIFIESDDQCMNCTNYVRGVSCPLLTALGLGVVYIENSLKVVDCGFYKKFERNLHIVSDGEDSQ